MSGSQKRDRPPKDDAEWARETARRLDSVEHSDALRAGPWVISAHEGSGDLIASHVDGGSVKLADVPDSDSDPDVVATDVVEWSAPSLASGYTSNGNDNGPIEYRVITDHGSRKLQLRGSVAITGDPDPVIWTLPEGPSSKRSVLVARNPAGGSNVDQVDFETGGAVRRVGSTIGVKASSGGPTGSRTGVDPGTAVTHTQNFTQTSNVNSSVYGFQGDGQPKTSGSSELDPQSSSHYHVMGHTHTLSHTHQGGAHQHALDVVTVSTFLSFNGVEIFL